MTECLFAVQEIIDTNHTRPKNQKLCNLENIREILEKFGVSVTKEPVEKVRIR